MRVNQLDVVLAIIKAERKLQNERWGRTVGTWPVADGLKLAALMEEVGEVAEELQQEHGDDERLFAELVQVAAVAVCWAETLITIKEVQPDA